MTDFITTIVLAIVQGLTEFLPVSSSGHLVLVGRLLGTAEGDFFLTIVLHVGTLGSVVVVYRREILRLLKFDGPAVGYIISLVVGTIPAVIVGLLAKDLVEGLFGSPIFAASGLLLTAGILLSTRFARNQPANLPDPWEPSPVKLPTALAVGCAQAFAIMPGISRSGSTIAMSLWMGLPRAEAARYSFLLSVPAISGALVLEILGGGVPAGSNLVTILGAAIVSFAVGLLAIRWTALAVVQSHFWKFSFYCLLVGLVSILVLKIGV